jgi:hypothetical protein
VPAVGDGKAVAHSSGAAAGPVGNTYATPEATATAVLGYEHDVAGASMALIDGAKGALRDQVSTTLFATLDRRDAAIAYIHGLPVPPPVIDDKALAHSAQTDQSIFPALMQGVIPDLEDELQQGRELRIGGALTTGEKRIVQLAGAQIGDTRDTIDTYWPQLPPADD